MRKKTNSKANSVVSLRFGLSPNKFKVINCQSFIEQSGVESLIKKHILQPVVWPNNLHKALRSLKYIVLLLFAIMPKKNQ